AAVQAALLREVTDAPEYAAGLRRLTENGDLAAVARDDVHDHPQRRRLPGAVRAEDAVDGAARYGERKVTHRHVRRVAARYVPELQGRHGRRGMRAQNRPGAPAKSVRVSLRLCIMSGSPAPSTRN